MPMEKGLARNTEFHYILRLDIALSLSGDVQGFCLFVCFLLFHLL